MPRLRAFRPAIYRILTALGSIASVIGVVFPLVEQPWPIKAWVGLGISTILFVALAIMELRSGLNTFVFSARDTPGIRDYMYDWIRSGGRVAIWTRDHSWVRDDEMRSLLEQKAQDQELILCLPKKTELAGKLEGLGAEIVAYGDVGGVPSGRFTIVHFERDGSAVAIGRSKAKGHIIEEHVANGDVAYHLAQDLVRLAKHAAGGGA